MQESKRSLLLIIIIIYVQIVSKGNVKDRVKLTKKHTCGIKSLVEVKESMVRSFIYSAH